MNLKDLQSRLENCNYFTQFISDTLIIGTDPQNDPDHPEISTYHAFCSVQIGKSGYVVEYSRSQLTKEKTFSTEADTMNFIKEIFPLETKNS